MPAQPEFQQRLQSIERLLAEVENGADPNVRGAVRQLMQLVIELHGAGLERIVALIHETGDASGLMDRLTADELVESLLVLHGIHPLGLEARVERAIARARTRLRPHRGEVELLGLEDGAVRVRIESKGHGCGSTIEALKEIVESAIYESAPDIASLAIDAGEDSRSFVPLAALQGAV